VPRGVKLGSPPSLGLSGWRPEGVRVWTCGRGPGAVRRCAEGMSEAYCSTWSTDITRVSLREAEGRLTGVCLSRESVTWWC
jgi:hypothetical protein